MTCPARKARMKLKSHRTGFVYAKRPAAAKFCCLTIPTSLRNPNFEFSFGPTPRCRLRFEPTTELADPPTVAGLVLSVGSRPSFARNLVLLLDISQYVLITLHRQFSYPPLRKIRSSVVSVFSCLKDKSFVSIQRTFKLNWSYHVSCCRLSSQHVLCRPWPRRCLLSYH